MLDLPESPCLISMDVFVLTDFWSFCFIADIGPNKMEKDAGSSPPLQPVGVELPGVLWHLGGKAAAGAHKGQGLCAISGDLSVQTLSGGADRKAS